MSAADLLVPEQTADEVRESLDVTQKGQTANTIRNCKTVFQHDPLLKGAVRYNLLTERIDIVRDLGWRRSTRVITDTDMKYLLLYFEETYGITSEKKIAAALEIAANENCYHPIRERLDSLVWDGQPRVRSCLHHFLGAECSDYIEEVFWHFLFGAIRRVFSLGCKYEEIRSFISRQKETYRTPYEAQPKDRLRQCVFGGTSNTLDFLPLDRAGNRRFLPVMVYPEEAEVHILEDEDASREYLLQVWVEAMTVYWSGQYSMKFSKEIQKQHVAVQKAFMPEDTEAGQIIGFLETYTGSMVCSKQLYREAMHHEFDDPKRWQLHNINEIMNTAVTGWKPFSNPRMFAGYGRQRGWERESGFGNEIPGNESGFVELTEEECRQLELPKEWMA